MLAKAMLALQAKQEEIQSDVEQIKDMQAEIVEKLNNINTGGDGFAGLD